MYKHVCVLCLYVGCICVRACVRAFVHAYVHACAFMGVCSPFVRILTGAF